MSAIGLFFSEDGKDRRGMQFAEAAIRDPQTPVENTPEVNPKLWKLIRVRDYAVHPAGVHDDAIHPEFKAFLVALGNYHRKVFGSPEAPQAQLVQLGGAVLSEHPALFKIVQDFNKLQLKDKLFFGAFVNLTNTAGASKELIEWTPDMKPSEWRLNLKKHAQGEPRFALFIPKEVREFYVNALIGTPADISGIAVHPELGFGIDVEKIFNELLRKPKEDAPYEVKEIGSIYDFTSHDIIDVKNGEFVRNKEILDSLPKEKCFTTQFQGDHGSCVKFIGELILSDDTEALNKYFASKHDSSFENIGAENIADMDPRMAVKILQKFGIKEYAIPEGGKMVKKFEHVSQWLEHIQSMGLSAESLQNITSNKKLIDYLEMIVSFVNHNPVILNSGVLEPKEAIPSEHASYLERTGVKRLPSLPLFETKGEQNVILKKLVEATKMTRGLISQPFGFPMMSIPRLQLGGGTASSLRGIIGGLIEDLGHNGKKLTTQDRNKIDESLKLLDKLDGALTGVAGQLSDFREWSNIIGGSRPEVVSLGKIEESLDKWKECASKYSHLELGLLNVAQKLSEKLK